MGPIPICAVKYYTASYQLWLVAATTVAAADDNDNSIFNIQSVFNIFTFVLLTTASIYAITGHYFSVFQ